MISELEANGWAKWVLFGDDYTPDLPHYHPLKPLADRITQAVMQAVKAQIDKRKKEKL